MKGGAISGQRRRLQLAWASSSKQTQPFGCSRLHEPAAPRCWEEHALRRLQAGIKTQRQQPTGRSARLASRQCTQCTLCFGLRATTPHCKNKMASWTAVNVTLASAQAATHKWMEHVGKKGPWERQEGLHAIHQ